MITPKRARFESIAKMTMPELFDTVNITVTEILDDWERFAYHLETPLSLEQIMDIWEEQNDMLLQYYFIPSNAILCGHSCCAVSNPEMENMVRISAITDDRGLCDTIHLTIFSSLDIFLGEITNERKRMMERYKFDFEETYCTFLTLMS